jgi:hypothetical protein
MLEETDVNHKKINKKARRYYHGRNLNPAISDKIRRLYGFSQVIRLTF